MMELLFEYGRDVTTDMFFFTSVPNADFLLQKNITITMTLRATRKKKERKPDIAAMMDTAKSRDILSLKFIRGQLLPKEKQNISDIFLSIS